MSSKLDLDKAGDPVCGRLVDVSTPHSAEMIGKKLYFCSEACLNRFLADPAAFDDEGTIVLSRAAAISDVSAVRVAARATADGATTAAPRPALAPPSGAHTGPSFGFHFVRSNPDARAAGEGIGALATWFARWVERRYVVRASREMLTRYRTIVQAYPGASRTELYRQLIIDRFGCDSAAADRALNQANDSFAKWPKVRELTLRDVIHFAAVVEFLTDHDRAQGMLADVDKLVAAQVPANL